MANWWQSWSPVYHTDRQGVDICVQHGGPEALRRAGLSAAAKTCLKHGGSQKNKQCEQTIKYNQLIDANNTVNGKQ